MTVILILARAFNRVNKTRIKHSEDIEQSTFLPNSSLIILLLVLERKALLSFRNGTFTGFIPQTVFVCLPALRTVYSLLALLLQELYLLCFGDGFRAGSLGFCWS